jgi:hypothetical protein
VVTVDAVEKRRSEEEEVDVADSEDERAVEQRPLEHVARRVAAAEAADGLHRVRRARHHGEQPCPHEQ